MSNPSPRKILVAVSGMSPQIITETLYALHTARQWVPDEVHLVTTSEGRKNADLQLLHGDGYFHRLLRDYRLTKPIHFNESTIYVIRDADGEELRDLRTPGDNEAAADFICEIIRKLTEMPDTELHVSLAGGRKTMGFYAGYALSLFGREQDRLSHVLVSEEYESLTDFFYPTPKKHPIYKRDGKGMLDAAKAEVWLADIPFVRLRSKLPESLLAGHHSFSKVIELARRATEKPHLKLYPRQRKFELNGIAGKLRPIEMGLLLWAAVRHKKGRNPIEPVIPGDDRSSDLKEFKEITEQFWLDLNKKTEDRLAKEGLTQAFLETNISRLNTCIKKSLGAELAELCKLASKKHGRGKAYALPENLEIDIE